MFIKYASNKIYVARVGVVCYKAFDYSCNPSLANNKSVLVKKERDAWNGSLIGKSIRNKTTYRYFHESSNYFLKTMQGQYMIYADIPLSDILPEVKKSYSRKELIDIEDAINHPEVKEKPKVTEEDVTDPVLALIINTSKKVKGTNISEDDKNYLYDALDELGKYYTSELIKIKCRGNNSLTITDPHESLKLDIIAKLNIIENDINTAIVCGTLNHECDAFNLVLKNNLK